MRSLGILIVAACLLAGCEDVPTTPSAGNQTAPTSAGSNQQSSTATSSQSTGHDAQGTIKDGKIDVQLPDGQISYN